MLLKNYNFRNFIFLSLSNTAADEMIGRFFFVHLEKSKEK